MSKSAVIFCGGEYVDPKRIDTDEKLFVVCADSGYDNALKAGFSPDIVIGDFDSIQNEIKDAEIMRLPVHKDETDTQVCVDYLIKNGFEKVYMICALGGRIDHTMANTALLAYGALRGIELTIVCENFYMFPIIGKKEIIGKPGEMFSVFPYGGNCTGVVEKGFEYELDGGTLFFDVPMGISNVLTENTANVEVENGILIAVHYR